MADKRFTEEQIQEFREAFHLFDKDGDNTITTPELLTVMKSLGHNPSRDDVIEMIKEVDSNGNGKIEFSEFLTLMEKNMNSFESEELIKGAFSVIDPHGEGYITLQGLRQVVHDLGLDFTDEEMRDMIEEADPTGEGRVNFEGVGTLFMETHLALSEEAKKKWESRKKRIPLPVFERTRIVEKPKLKKLPGRKVTKQEARNIQKFNSLSLQTEKNKVLKKPGVSIKESNKHKPKKEDYFTEDEDESLGDKKVRIVKKAGLSLKDRGIVKEKEVEQESDEKQEFKSKQNDKVRILKKPKPSIRERRELEPDQTNDISDLIEDNQRHEKVRVLKKPGLSLREQGLIQSRQSDYISDDETKVPIKSKKAKVIKRKGLSIKERRELESETDDYISEYDDDDEEEVTNEGVRLVKVPTSTLRDRGLVKSKYNIEPSSDTRENNFEKGKYKVRVVKRRGVSRKHTDNECVTDDELEAPNGRNSSLSDSIVYKKKVKKVHRKSLRDKYLETQIREEEETISRMSQRSLNNQSGGDLMEYDEYEAANDHQANHYDGHLPSIEPKYGSSNQVSPTSPRKMAVYERLYDPDFRKNRSVPTEPEPIYVREFKSRPPKQLEHVKSRHMDAQYFEPKGEYVLETEEEEGAQQFKSKPPKNLEHVTSRHLSPEYVKKKQSQEGGNDVVLQNNFISKPPKKLEHVQSKILDPRYFKEKQYSEEEEVLDNEFKARLPKKLEHVQSKIMDAKYYQERQPPEEEKLDNEFKARLPKKLEHVQSRILEPPRKSRPTSEEADSISLPSFRAKPPKHLEQVGSRILDPAFYEPRPEYVYETEDDNIDHNFKARLPKGLQHVESRALDSKYFKKKTKQLTTEEREALNANHNFKARLPKSLAHVQSRAFDPYYNKALSPRHETPVVELKQKGKLVVINVKKESKDKQHQERSKSEGYRDRFDAVRGRDIFNEEDKELGKLDSPKESETTSNKKERRPWRPPRKPKVEKIDRDYFDSWTVTPTHIYNDSNDMFYRNRRNVSEMWTSLAKSIKKSVIDNGDRVRAIERTYY